MADATAGFFALEFSLWILYSLVYGEGINAHS